MSDRNDSTREFDDLFAQWREATASPQQIDQLESMVAADPQLAERCVELTHLQVQLQWSFGLAPDHALATDTSTEPVDQPADLVSSRRPASNRFFRYAVGAGVAIALLFATGTVFWPVVLDRRNVAGNDDEPPRVEKAEPFIAWLSGSNQPLWADETEPHRSQLTPGQRLVIESGQIRIQYRTGTEVVIEGPAEFIVGRKAIDPGQGQSDRTDARPSSFVLDPANAGYLVHGRLVARCETLRSKGFVVDTPTARVEDLGTEFGVVAEVQGNTAVHVVRGEVETCLVDASGDWGDIHALTAGKALLLDANRGLVDAIDFDVTDLPQFRAIPQARPMGIIVSDSFSADGSVPLRRVGNLKIGNMKNRVPDGINLPGLKWNDFNGSTAFGGQVVLGGDTGATISLDSYGGYIRPHVLELSADVTVGDLTDGGDGSGGIMLGFAAEKGSGWQSWTKFTGLVLHQDGRLQYRELGKDIGPAIDYAGSFLNTRSHHLAYVVDTRSGAISNVRLEGSSAKYDFSIGTYAASNYKYAAIYGNAGKPRQRGQLDNFTVSEFVPIAGDPHF